MDKTAEVFCMTYSPLLFLLDELTRSRFSGGVGTHAPDKTGLK
jgi:hypothetical protein